MLSLPYFTIQLISSLKKYRQLVHDIFICIFVNGKFCIVIEISLRFVSKGPTDNNPAMV